VCALQVGKQLLIKLITKIPGRGVRTFRKYVSHYPLLCVALVSVVRAVALQIFHITFEGMR